MSKSKKKPALSKEQARSVFRQSFGDGSVILTKHERKRMRENEVTTNDLLSLGRSGVVLSEPEQDINTGQLKYRIESDTLKMKVVFIPTDKKVRILTVMVD